MERASFLRHLPGREILVRPALAAAVTFTPVSPNFLTFPQSCEQKVASSHIEQQIAPEHIGFTFSAGAAEWHGLEPIPTLETLMQQGFTKVRLGTYMDRPTERIITELDEQLEIVKKYGGSVILEVGGKAPHYPEWYIDPANEEEEIAKASAVIEVFGDDPYVEYFQLSNEPFFSDFFSRWRMPPEKPHVLDAIYAKMREYNKKIIVTHLVGTRGFDEEGFRKAAAYADIVGLDLYNQVGLLRVSCKEHVETMQKYKALADELGVELWVTESQTVPWIQGVPLTNVTLPDFLHDDFRPTEILELWQLANMYLEPRVILEWDILAAYDQKLNGDPRSWNEIMWLIQIQRETDHSMLPLAP